MLDGVEIGALEVLDQRQLETLLEAAATAGVDDDRHLGQSGDLGGAESPLAGDQLVAGEPLPNEQGLEDTVNPDRVGELLQRRRIEGAAWLLGVRFDFADRDLQREAAAGAVVAELFDVLPGRDEGLQAPSQTSSFVHLAINSLVSSW